MLWASNLSGILYVEAKTEIRMTTDLSYASNRIQSVVASEDKALVLPLSDDAWSCVSHLLPCDSKRRYGRTPRDPREVLNAILWVVTRSEQWRELPAYFPPRKTCQIKLLQWRRAGILSKVFEKLGVVYDMDGS